MTENIITRALTWIIDQLARLLPGSADQPASFEARVRGAVTSHADALAAAADRYKAEIDAVQEAATARVKAIEAATEASAQELGAMLSVPGVLPDDIMQEADRVKGGLNQALDATDRISTN